MDKIVLVDYYSDTCAPCKMMVPIINQVREEYLDLHVLVISVNVGEFPETVKKENITSVPTLILYKNDIEVSRKVGFIPKNKLIEWIEGVRN